MKGNKVASRYAQALLDLAVEQNATDRVNVDMVEFAAVYNESKELQNLMKSPVVPGKKKLDVLAALFGGKMDKMSTAFMALIVKQSRENLLGEMASAFTELYKAHKNILDVFVTSATPLEQSVKDKILQKIKAKHTGEIVLTELVDEKLVGGFVVRFGDRQLDASIASQLTNLRNLLLN
jgi:F-type H+-transporting ATPase subunit delta